MREAFDCYREGDVLVVARLDWLGRPLRELIDHLVVGREVETKRAKLLDSHSSLGSGDGRPSSPITLSRNT